MNLPVLNASFIVTCEHAGYEIPPEFRYLFDGREDVLQTHRGWDPGALYVAEFFSERLQVPLFYCEFSRLLIEANRSVDSAELFSEFTRGLSDSEKQKLKDEIYFSYRQAVEDEIQAMKKPIIHISIHSFTPVLNGIKREVDIGFLFDPSRMLENTLCQAWANNLTKVLPGNKIKFNEPYKGTDDGFTTYLRTKLKDSDYAGIEIEINQRFVGNQGLDIIQATLVHSLPLEY